MFYEKELLDMHFTLGIILASHLNETEQNMNSTHIVKQLTKEA